MPRHEGNKMMGGVWPNLRLRAIALATASTLAGAVSPSAHAEPSAASAGYPHVRGLGKHPHGAFADQPASAAIMRTAVPPEMDERRRDGHMTPEERRLLRQHIEDAVRELYKR